jgi:hypothetical protein
VDRGVSSCAAQYRAPTRTGVRRGQGPERDRGHSATWLLAPARDRPRTLREHLWPRGDRDRRGSLGGRRLGVGARRELRLRSTSPSRDLVEIWKATLGARSGMLGAALTRGENREYVL